MNAKLYILAILTIIILALYMTVSAPAQKAVPEQSVVEQTIALKAESYKTLGGDCSADRATGDLYVQSHDPYANQPDPYCLTDQGPTNNLLSDLDKDRGSDTSYVPAEKQTSRPGNDSSTAQTDKHAKKQKDDKSAPSSSELANIPVTGNTNGPSSGQTDISGGSSDPQINPQPGNPDEGGSKPKDDKPSNPPGNTNPNTNKQHKDKDNGSSEHKVDQKPDNPGKDQGSDDKQCKKDGRDNANSQGNHNCSADNPDTNSDQQRSNDHRQDNQSQGNGHDKDKEKKDK